MTDRVHENYERRLQTSSEPARGAERNDVNSQTKTQDKEENFRNAPGLSVVRYSKQGETHAA